MPDFTNTQIPPPGNWQDFQRLCADLWQHIWNDPGTQIHGRPGQKQDGIDVYGRPNRGENYEGVQCKGKDGLYGQKVTETELRREVEKAKYFDPPISRFILATSTPVDQAIQEVARVMTVEHQKKGLFSVDVLGWEELHRRLGDYPELIPKHFRFLTPQTEQLADDISILKARPVLETPRAEDMHLETMGVMKNEILPILQRIADTEVGSKNPIDKHLNDDIDQCREWIHQRKSKEALEQLERIRAQNWEVTTDRTKFRIITNIAAANLKLGDKKRAAEGFIEAVKYDPNDEIGICNLALAHLIFGNQDEAQEAAYKAVKMFPDSARAYSLLVSVKAEVTSVDDPPDIVPHDLLMIADVAYALGRFYLRKEKYFEAVEWMRKANEASPDDVEVKAGLAEAILSHIIENDATAKGRILSSSQRDDIEQLIKLLEDVWSEVRRSDEVVRFIVHAFNLSNAHYLLGEFEPALNVIEDALLVAPKDPMLHRQVALINIVQGNYSHSAEVLSKLADDAFPEKVLMEAEALNGAERTEDALARIEKFLKSDSSEEFKSQAKKLHLELISKYNNPHAAKVVATEYLKDDPCNISLLLAFSKIQSIIGENVESINILRKAFKTVRPSNTYSERYFLAEALFEKRLFQEAAEIYRTLVGSDGDSHVMRRLLVCMLETDQRRSVSELLDSLSDKEREEPFYLKISGVIHRRIGELEKAKESFAAYLKKKPEDLQVRLGWAEVLHRLGEHDLLKEFLESPQDYPRASLEDQLHLCALLVAYNFEERAVELAYKQLRQHPDNPKVHMGYIALLLQGRSNQKWLDIERVSIDSTFVIEMQDGRRQSFTIESGIDVKLDLMEIPPDHPTAKKALGKRVGDLVTLTETPFRSLEGRIVQVKHKYIHAFHESIQNYEIRFPGAGGLWSLPITKDGDGELDFSQIIKVLKEQEAQRKRIKQAYRKNHLPLSVLSRLNSLNPIRLWANMDEVDGFRILTCEGNVPERQRAINLIEKATIPPVIEPITLYCIWVAEIQNAVFEIFGGLCVTQGTINLIEHLIEHLKSGMINGFLGTDGERLVYSEFDNDSVKNEISRLKSLRSWVSDRCTLLPAISKGELGSEQIKLAEVMDPAFYDTLLAAEGHDRILISEDYHFRNLARELLGIEGTWIQPILMRALESGFLEFPQYAEAVSRLVGMGHSFTTIDSKILMYFAEQGDWKSFSGKFVRVVSTLGLKTVELKSALKVTLEFLFMIWDPHLPILIWERMGFLSRMISVLSRHACREVYSILEALVLIAPDICRGNQGMLNEYFSTILRWCKGHFIETPHRLRDL